MMTLLYYCFLDDHNPLARENSDKARVDQVASTMDRGKGQCKLQSNRLGNLLVGFTIYYTTKITTETLLLLRFLNTTTSYSTRIAINNDQSLLPTQATKRKTDDAITDL